MSTSPEAEAVKVLAQKRCPACANVDDDTLYLDDGRTWTPEEIRANCEDCSGTGLRFPGLVRECCCLCHDVNEPEWVWPDRCQGKELCGYCSGTRYVPVSPAEALAYLVGHKEFRSLRVDDVAGQLYLATWAGANYWYNLGEGTTPLVALANAIAKG